MGDGKKLKEYLDEKGTNGAKKVKEVTPQQREEIIRRTARDYMLYASWFKEEE